MKRLILPALVVLAAVAGAVLAQATANRGVFEVRVPADATIVIGKQTMASKGSFRRFISPELEPGYTYWYQFEVTWTEHGKELKESRRVEFRPGQTVPLDFTGKSTTETKKVESKSPEPLPKPEPKKPEPKTAEPKPEPKKTEAKPTEAKPEIKKTETKPEPKKPEPKVEPKKPETKTEVKQPEPSPSPAVEAGFTALFNGKDLSGWKTFPEKAEQTFFVKDGVIVVTGKPAGYFYSDKSYQNYVLRYEWRFQRPENLKNDADFPGNSGLLFHIQEPHKVWPKSIEVQGMNREHGRLLAVSGAKLTNAKFDAKTLAEVRKPVGEWNTTEVTVNGTSVVAKVNGAEVASGNFDLTSGPIGFQSEGAELHFRNLRIKVLPAPPPPPAKNGSEPPEKKAPDKKATEPAPDKKPAEPAPEKKPALTGKEPNPVVAPAPLPKPAGDDGFVDLFNGKNLDGWKTFLDPKAANADPAKTFVVANGEIHVSGSPNGYFYTVKSYKNYVIRYDWTYPKEQPEKTTMNSGLLVHIQEPHKIWPKSVEPQGRYKDHGKFFFPGFTDKPAAKDDEDARKKALKASDEWNTTEVTCKADGTVSVRINGIPVSETKTELTEGPLGFQSEGARIHFRNIKIKMLP